VTGSCYNALDEEARTPVFVVFLLQFYMLFATVASLAQCSAADGAFKTRLLWLTRLRDDGPGNATGATAFLSLMLHRKSMIAWNTQRDGELGNAFSLALFARIVHGQRVAGAADV
jgi:hypothetical protein